MKIKVAITDERISGECKRNLELSGFHIITLPPDKRLSPAVASHTDMLICRLGSELIANAGYFDSEPVPFSDIWELCRKSGITIYFTDDEISPEYPMDCRLNALALDGKLFCKSDTVSSYLKQKAEEIGMSIVHVKQGYPACTVLKLDDTHAVTADRGMAAAMRKSGITVTEILPGAISLPPHDYGFIGGCAGVYEGVVYFTGDPRLHPSFPDINRAVSDAGLIWRALSGDVLTDVGGILFLDGTLE